MDLVWILNFIRLTFQSEISYSSHSTSAWTPNLIDTDGIGPKANVGLGSFLSGLGSKLGEHGIDPSIIPDRIKLADPEELGILKKWGNEGKFIYSLALFVLYWADLGEFLGDKNIEWCLLQAISEVCESDDIKILTKVFGDIRFKKLKDEFLRKMITSFFIGIELKDLVELAATKLFENQGSKKSICSAIYSWVMSRPIQDDCDCDSFHNIESIMIRVRFELDEHFNRAFGHLSDDDTFEMKRHLLSLSHNQALFLLQWRNIRGDFGDTPAVFEVFMEYACRQLGPGGDYCPFFKDFSLLSPNTLSEAIANWWSSLELEDPTQISSESWDGFLEVIFNNICILTKNQIGRNPYGLICSSPFEGDEVIAFKKFTNPIAKLVVGAQRDINNNCVLQNPDTLFTTMGDLGSGGGGSVTLVASKENPNVKLALKRVELKGYKRSAPKEITILSKMSHSNVIDYYDCFYEKSKSDGATWGVFWIAMEYASNVSLQKVSSYPEAIKDGILNWILISILDGLDYIHSQGFIHLDIKPANIVITSSGNVKIIDLGLTTSEGDLPYLLGVSGTRGFIAPEVYAGKSLNVVKGCQADIWSFGMLLHYLVDGSIFKPSLDKYFMSSLCEASHDWTKTTFNKWKLKGKNIQSLSPKFSSVLKRLFKDCLGLKPERRPNAASIQEILWKFPVDPIGLRDLVFLIDQVKSEE